MSRLRLSLTIAIAVLSVSVSSLLVKWNTEAPPLTIAFYRMLWASLLLFPVYFKRRQRDRGPWPGSAWRHLLILTAGVSLALHFAFWITSLRHTSVAVSVFLVNSSPLMVALLSFLVWGERLTRLGLVGILLSMLGAACMTLGPSSAPATFLGGVYALLGAFFLSTYWVTGHRLLREQSLWHYVYPTYTTSAVFLGFLVWLRGDPLSGFRFETHLLMFLLGAVPQCLGHTSYNRALQYLSPVLVSLLLLGEPVTASLLAYVLLDEAPGSWAALGAAAIGVGIFLVSWRGLQSSSRTRVAVAVIRSTAGVLVQRRRAGSHLEGFLEFPGGKVKAGETIQQAATREVLEETGIQLSRHAPSKVSVEFFHYPDRDLEIHFLFFEISDPGRPFDGDWVRAADMREQDFPPANRKVIQRLKQTDTGRPAE